VSDHAPEAQLWDALRGALVTRALAIAADLRIADALAAGPRRVDELAEEAGVDADVLRRILRALASDGIFAERERGVFENTEASELLSRDGWDDFARLFGGVWHRTAGELDATGSELPFPRVFGTDFWDWLAKHPDERAAFDRAMEQGWQRRVQRLGAVDWREGEMVVDVGGGNGSLLLALLRRYPRMRGIVFDLPETNRDEAALREAGIEFVAGDFFERVPSGDVYILGTILHDWDDDSAEAILRTICAAAPPASRLVVVDAVVPEGNERHGAKWLDLLMLGLFGGRERDAAQWRALLEAAAFEPVRIDDGLIEARCR
jgi:O-methyltransferase domain/Dimerisation domain